MDGGAVVNGFDEALNEVEAVVTAFNAAAGDEIKSQEAKNAALYAALDRAFQFHRTWHGTPQFTTLLEQRKVNAKPRGKNASPFIPTIKAFFDASLDSFAPSDEAGRTDKARRQKTVSTYSKVLEFAASSEESSRDVAAFIVEHGGIEATKTEWVDLQKQTDEAQAEAEKAKLTKLQNLEAGLAALKVTMAKALPEDEARKGTTALAALYFDDAGVAHLLGFPAISDSSKALLEKFILDAAPVTKKGNDRKAGTEARPQTDLDKLLRLLAVGKVAHPSDANVKIVNGTDHCELWSSHGSTQTCMAHAVLARQDYLPEGTYWFGAKAIKALQQLAKLGAHGAQFTIDGPALMEGRTAIVKVTVTNQKAAIKAYDTKANMVSWDWLEAIPNGDARCRTENADGSTTIAYKAVTEKLAQAKPIAAWDAEFAVEGEFAAWLERTLGIGKKDANARLVKAVYGGATGKLTTLHIGANAWALKDNNGVVEAYELNAPIATNGFSTEFTAGVGELLAAVKAVKALAGKGVVTVSLLDKLMRVRCEAESNTAEIFIPAYTADGRYTAHTVFAAN